VEEEEEVAFRWMEGRMTGVDIVQALSNAPPSLAAQTNDDDDAY
jgi:hypothetical protein